MEQNDPASVLQHHIVHSGLHGFITNRGQKKLSNPESHIDTLSQVKTHLRDGRHEDAVNALHGHPLGLDNKAALAPIVQHIAGSVANSDLHPEALKASVQYLNNAQNGHKKVKDYAKNVFEKEPKRRMDYEKLNSLKSELAQLQTNPEKVFEIASGVGHYLPGHNAEIGAQIANAVGYLNSIKPANQSGGPLDKILKPSHMEEYKYNRALSIAEDPMSIIHYAKDGTIEPQDLVTLNTLYPKVAESIRQKATETLLEKHASLSMKQKRSISAILGEPLMFSQTPEACLAIMKANAPQPQQSPKNKKSSSKATAADLKEIDKVNKLYATPLQERQIDHKD